MFRRAVVVLFAMLACGVGLASPGHAAHLARCLLDGTGRARQDDLQHHVLAVPRRRSRWQHGACAQGRSLSDQLGR